MFISQDMIDFIRFLKQHKVKYVLVGGFAVIYFGYVRTTQDIDILILPSPENAKKMIKVFQEFGFGNVGFSRDIALFCEYPQKIPMPQNFYLSGLLCRISIQSAGWSSELNPTFL